MEFKFRNFLKAICIIVAIQILTGCSVPQKKLSSEVQGKTVAVISVVGDYYTVQSTGFTVFTNWTRQEKVAAWEIDKFVEIEAARFINSKKGNVRAIIADSSDIKMAADNKKYYMVSIESVLFHRSQENIDQVRNHALNVGADYALVIGNPSQWMDPYFDSNQHVRGYGIYQRNKFGRKSGIDYVLIKSLLIDAHTGKVVGVEGTARGGVRGEDEWVETQETFDVSKIPKKKENIFKELKYAISDIVIGLALVND